MGTLVNSNIHLNKNEEQSFSKCSKRLKWRKHLLTPSLGPASALSLYQSQIKISKGKSTTDQYAL